MNTAQTDEKRAARIEELTREAEIRAARIEELTIEAEMWLREDDTRKERKEKRGFIKQTLYNGSNKLKHVVPKGKHL